MECLRFVWTTDSGYQRTAQLPIAGNNLQNAVSSRVTRPAMSKCFYARTAILKAEKALGIGLRGTGA